MTTTLALALADMRKGRRVLMVTATKEGARALLDEARALLTTGERGHRAASVLAVYRNGGGQIRFAPIVTVRAGYLGMAVDTVLVDRTVPVDTELREALAPAQCTSTDPTFICM